MQHPLEITIDFGGCFFYTSWSTYSACTSPEKEEEKKKHYQTPKHKPLINKTKNNLFYNNLHELTSNLHELTPFTSLFDNIATLYYFDLFID